MTGRISIIPLCGVIEMAKNAFFVLAAYDIPDDGRRTRIMNTLLDYGGKRVNYSVFECLLPQSKLTKMKNAIEEIMNFDEDNIRYYTICENCIRSIENRGVEVTSVIDEETDIFI
jgi:CRISPR-associated protein Cas2